MHTLVSAGALHLMLHSQIALHRSLADENLITHLPAHQLPSEEKHLHSKLSKWDFLKQ